MRHTCGRCKHFDNGFCRIHRMYVDRNSIAALFCLAYVRYRITGDC